MDVWHQHFGHICENSTRRLKSLYQLPVDNRKIFDCKSCILSKSYRLPYSNIHSPSTSPLDLIYVDVWGLVPHLSIQCDRYYILFVDGCMKFNWFFPLICKSDVKRTFIDFKARIQKSTNLKIKALQANNGGEFVALILFLRQHGIHIVEPTLMLISIWGQSNGGIIMSSTLV